MWRTKDQVAQEIIAEGVRQGITPRGIVIGLAVGLVETGLVVYANAKVPGSLGLPHDAVGDDGRSVGPLQQQVVMGDGGWWWGPVEVCQDPTGSARLFFQRLTRRDYTRGDPGAHAQAIQQSAFPDRYAARMAEARGIYDRLSHSDTNSDTQEVPPMGDPTWLPDVLRAAGLRCNIYPGAMQRGHGDFGVGGMVFDQQGFQTTRDALIFVVCGSVAGFGCWDAKLLGYGQRAAFFRRCRVRQSSAGFQT